jgi:hypothetical protein
MAKEAKSTNRFLFYTSENLGIFFGWEALIFQSLRSSDIRVNTGRVFNAKD